MNVRCEAVKAYRTKESFGDLDILVERSQYDIAEMITQLYKPNQIVKNGNVWSFDYKQFQIDLIIVEPDLFDCAVDYHAWNDLGNFIGRIAHKLGFKYGSTGLYLPMRDGDTHMFANILVSSNTERILEFLGYNPAVFFVGFDTMYQVFEFASSTPYFNKHIFDEENRSHKSRVRDAKRKSYHDYVVWMNCTDGLPRLV